MSESENPTVLLREKTAPNDWEFYVLSNKGLVIDVKIISVEFGMESKLIDSGYVEVAPSERIYYQPPTAEERVKINPDEVLILADYKTKDWENYDLTSQEESVIEAHIIENYER